MNSKTRRIIQENKDDWRAQFAMAVDLVNGTSFSVDALDRRKRRQKRKLFNNGEIRSHVKGEERNGLRNKYADVANMRRG